MSDMYEIRILVIDDEPFFLKILTRQLNNLGYRDVVACTRAEDGLEALGADPATYQLIFCDLGMPGMDGIEFIRHLVGTAYVGGLVLISGEDPRILQAAQLLAKAHKLNILGAVEKPVLPTTLADILKHVKGEAGCGRVRSAPQRYCADDLLAALDRHELINHYQPQVSVASGDFVAVEALVRWQHPMDGMVFPDQFIGLAEESNLIGRLTEAVLLEGLRFIDDRNRSGMDINLSVNVSMDNLVHLEFPDFVMRVASDANVPVTQLVLEVTESRLMKDRLISLDNLTRLRLKKVGLSIDDFGTGHSSLAQLRDIPFNELKIDRGFTHGAADNPALRAIFEGSMGMAKHLGMVCVAEGVEDEADWQYLRQVGCDLAQGYFIGKPMAAEDLPGWHVSWQAKWGRM
ncbi:MAG: EAL domain-containing response regulator [Gammaproteobacteria bacterium]|nr:EAL domain-containing response regulator [Gammaproteobacteria bacterium]MDP2346492.1 EAL domain-containing response regulator [Gammaproteobacteria bacterium]